MSLTDLEREFTSTHGGTFMSSDGVVRNSVAAQKKVCFVVTDKSFLVDLLYRLSLRDDCHFVKYSVHPRDGMYLGRCFLTSDTAAGHLCAEYKSHPKLMVTIQDDEFFAVSGQARPRRLMGSRRSRHTSRCVESVPNGDGRRDCSYG
jgi:hypothetical protein